MSIDIVSPTISLRTTYYPAPFPNEWCLTETQAGGPGIELAKALRGMDIKSRVLGFLGGFSGYELKDLVHKEGINLRFIKTHQDSMREVHLKNSERPSSFLLNTQSPKHSALKALEKLMASSTAKTMILRSEALSSFDTPFFSTALSAFPRDNLRLYIDFGHYQTLITQALASRPFFLMITTKDFAQLNTSTEQLLIRYGIQHLIITDDKKAQYVGTTSQETFLYGHRWEILAEFLWAEKHHKPASMAISKIEERQKP